MKNDCWTRIDCTWQGDPAVPYDILTAWLLFLGVESTEEIPQGLRFYLPPSQPSQSLVQNFQQIIETHFGGSTRTLTFHSEPIETRDWMEEWKKGFDVLALSSHLWICPSWKTFTPPNDQYCIHMDPGMAFGTGHHASTRLIAQAMEDQIFELQGKKVVPEVLDVGTGTGVLAMGAALLGGKRVVAIDNDPEALDIARENILINKLEKEITVETLSIKQLRRKFDLIVANILAEVHLDLLPYYIKRLRPGGILLLSGVIQDQVDRVRTHVLEHGWIVLNKREQGEWACLTAIQERRKRVR